MMKLCSKCNLHKDIDLFVKQEKSSDGLFPWCDICRTNYRKSKYNTNLENNRKKNNHRRKQKIAWLQSLKNKPCKDCGNTYEPYCMDFDHVSNNKIKSVTRMLLDNASQESILLEIEKCDLVCLLCHNKRTHLRFDSKLGVKRKYKANQQRNIDIINRFKNCPCKICGQQYEAYNMQIDHMDPKTKLYDVCDLKNYKLQTLQYELAKCQVLCALCHRRKSILEQQDEKYNIERPKPTKRKELFFNIDKKIKECGLCKEIKSFDFFKKDEKTASGLFTYCRDCFNKYRRDRRKNATD